MKANCMHPGKGLVLAALLLMSCLLLIVSCSKDVDQTITPPPPPVNILGDSVYLEKIYTLDSISPARMDTTYFTKFEYDNLKRVIRALDYDYAVSPHVPVNKQIFFYSGQDTLPYKVQLNTTTDMFYFYTNTRKIFGDSTQFASGTYIVRKYNPIPGGYLYENIFLLPAGIFRDTATILQTLQNGHIVQETKEGRRTPLVNYFYEYDANPNPLKKLNLDNAPVVFDGLQDFRQGVDANNITKTIHQTSLGEIIVNNHYLYNANGLPHRVYSYNGNRLPNTADSIRIVRFEYTDL